MHEQRRLTIDLFALGLFALTVFLALSFWSYDPADPPTRLVHPANAVPQNLCGHAGAWASQMLFGAFGVGGYGLILLLGAAAVMLIARREVNDLLLRAFGASVALWAVCTVATMALPDWSPGPVIGAGGYVGAVGRGLLSTHFATIGSYIVIAGVLLGGLLLVSDYLVFRALALPLAVTGRGVLLIAGKKGSRKSREQDEDDEAEEDDDEELEDEYEEDEYEDEEEDEYEEEDEDAEVAVRIPGQVQEEHDEEEVDVSDEPELEESRPKRRVGRLAAALGIGRGPAKDTEREQVLEELEAAADAPESLDYEIPPMDLLLESESYSFEEHKKEVRRKAKILEKTFASFGFNVKVIEIETGPVIAQFEVQLDTGLRLSRITGLADDLAIALRVPNVRIVAPIPGKNTVGIEVPNGERQLVRLREVIEEVNGRVRKMRIPIYLGKDVSGNPLVFDLTAMPHLLIAGRTGTGKSVCLNTIIMSMLMTRRPEDVRLLLIDPKMVELSSYMKLPHLMHPVVTDMRKAEAILAWAVEKMEERYQLLARAGVRHISVYNQLGEEEIHDRIGLEEEDEHNKIPTHLPYIVIVADEIADLMMTAPKEVESHIIRLAQKSRAVGIHLVLATQKPSVDVITGLIKSNLPARISFQVASRTDSRVVLDEMGADRLLGDGDLLFLWPGTSTLLRGQGAYVSDDEISRVVDAVGTSEPQFVHELVHLPVDNGTQEPGQLKNRDDLYEAAVEVVVREQRGSVSLLQRSLGIGYGRAARLIDFMAEDGIVGEYNGSQARDVQIDAVGWERMLKGEKQLPAPPPVAPERPIRAPRNRILPAPEDVEEQAPFEGGSSLRSGTILTASSRAIAVRGIAAPVAEDEFENDEEQSRLADEPDEELWDEQEADGELDEEDEELHDEAAEEEEYEDDYEDEEEDAEEDLEDEADEDLDGEYEEEDAEEDEYEEEEDEEPYDEAEDEYEEDEIDVDEEEEEYASEAKKA